MDHYGSISESLAEGFWKELQEAFAKVGSTPEAHHFDQSGLRRVNLKRFPYNVLYVVKEDRIRVQVVRHNRRDPRYGSHRK